MSDEQIDAVQAAIIAGEYSATLYDSVVEEIARLMVAACEMRSPDGLTPGITLYRVVCDVSKVIGTSPFATK